MARGVRATARGSATRSLSPERCGCAPPPRSQYLLQLCILPGQLEQHGVVKELVDGHLRSK